jgi:hypothetical protein
MPLPTATLRGWILAGLVAITGGWMAFDGAHALITGDFVTPSSGPYAGQLGPWTVLPRALGLEPRGLPVRVFFVAFGLGYLAALAVFLRGRPGSWRVLLGFATVALLYLPIGTVASVFVLALLIMSRPRGEPPRGE